MEKSFLDNGVIPDSEIMYKSGFLNTEDHGALDKTILEVTATNEEEAQALVSSGMEFEDEEAAVLINEPGNDNLLGNEDHDPLTVLENLNDALRLLYDLINEGNFVF